MLGHPQINALSFMLRSAVGMTHILRSGLVMDYTTSYFPYSEIDHLHLSIEAQCVSHLLPLGDCHNASTALSAKAAYEYIVDIGTWSIESDPHP